MRFVVTMLIIMAIVFGVQSCYFRDKLTATRDEAIAMLPDNPAGGFERLKKGLVYSNFVSLGATNKVRSDFFNELRDLVIADLERTPSERIAYDRMLNGLRTLVQAESELELSKLEEHRRAIIQAAHEMEPTYQVTSTLPNWDSFVKAMEIAHKENLVPPEPFSGYEDWRTSIKNADRQRISLRAVNELVALRIQTGVNSLGKSPGYSEADPLMLPLDKELGSGALIGAEHAFGEAKAACEHHQRLFQLPQIPPELSVTYGKLVYNLGVIKTTHIRQNGYRELSNYSSGYIVDLVMPRNVDAAIPTEGQMFGAFINGTNGLVLEAVKIFEALYASPNRTPEIAPMLAASYKSLLMFGEDTRRKELIDQAQSGLTRLKAQVSLEPVIAQVVGQIDALPTAPLVIR